MRHPIMGKARGAGPVMAIALAGLTLVAVPSAAQMGQGGHRMQHHGADGTGHDMRVMPGLRGDNATPQESAELQVLFHHFDTLSREVELLPDGIRTVTRASDPMVAEALISHVVGMIGRVEAADDPQIYIQSPTLDIFFLRGDSITSTIETTQDEIVVIQTSTDPEVVAALQTHAAEVTRMADQGMHAVHMMMMERAQN
ncbi:MULTISPECIES: hypothetical protein [unclassified Meridianimarinicoccus]|uniref:hypothetical protein n=1 Tax=unclassified Meridianimarinicoccus TaxID=2923344 RepID=UPI001D00233A|nr:hypothetical protein [Fluviibacterium sp. MJW13]